MEKFICRTELDKKIFINITITYIENIVQIYMKSIFLPNFRSDFYVIVKYVINCECTRRNI